VQDMIRTHVFNSEYVCGKPGRNAETGARTRSGVEWSGVEAAPYVTMGEGVGDRRWVSALVLAGWRAGADC